MCLLSDGDDDNSNNNNNNNNNNNKLKIDLTSEYFNTFSVEIFHDSVIAKKNQFGFMISE